MDAGRRRRWQHRSGRTVTANPRRGQRCHRCGEATLRSEAASVAERMGSRVGGEQQCEPGRNCTSETGFGPKRGTVATTER